jgi:hypothetical protein
LNNKKRRNINEFIQLFNLGSLSNKKTAQQSVHPTLGILARFQAFFYASAFSSRTAFRPPTPARVTPTVGQATP